MDIQIKKVGDKLKSLRKSLGLKQEDLVKHQVISGSKEVPFTRNLISMIETNKSPMTNKLKETIHKNILMACKEQGIPFDYDFTEVCITPEEQVDRYINNYKDNLFDSMLFEDAVKYGEELIVLSENYKLQKSLSILYRFLSEKSKKINLELASKYYLKASVLKSELTDTEYISLIKSFKAALIRLGKYSDALKLNYDKSNTLNLDTLKCNFNDILCLKKLKRYDEALSEISKISDILEKADISLFIKTKMLEANIQKLNKDIYSSIKSYNALLSKTSTADHTLLIKTNIIKLKTLTSTCTLSELEELSKITLTDSFTYQLRSLFFKTLSEGYEDFDMVQSISYFKKSTEIALSASFITTETRLYFNKLLCGIMTNKAKMDQYLKESEDNFKNLVCSGLEKNLVDNDTIFKILLHFQNRTDYSFVNRLLESKVS